MLEPITVLFKLNHWVSMNLINIEFAKKNIWGSVRGALFLEGPWQLINCMPYFRDYDYINGVISGFRRGVNEIFAFLWCYAA